MGKHFCFVLRWIFIFIFPNIIYPQLDNPKLDLYEIFDQTVGEETSGLYNGIQYYNEFVVLDDKHQFLGTNKFLKGFVHYRNQNYYNVFIKYDLFYDEIIVRPQNASSSLAFKLIKNHVDEFTLNEKTFVNLKTNSKKAKESLGYCEVLLKTELFGLYKKYRKKAAKKRNGEKVFFEFNLSHSFYLKYNGKLNLVSTRSELITIFPNYKSVVKDYYKAYKRLLKSDPDMFMKLLLVRLNELEQPKKA